ncbi:MAG: hypothetical protein JW909_05075 [Planctomycetes bacterium]|nr:hypothetical protein [Planctomycetota bacterium]
MARAPINLLITSVACIAACGAARGTEVTGRSDKPLAEVVFVKRVEPRRFKDDAYLPETYPAAVAKDGRSFVIKDLAEGTYDLRVRLVDGSVIEGVGLGKTDVPERAGPLEEADVAALTDIVAHMRTFFDRNRVFFIDGWRGVDDLNRQGYAWMLVEELRWRDTSLGRKKGEPFVIWRMDVWQFEKMAGAWRKVKQFKVIYRLNVTEKDFEKYRWYFTTAMAGYQVKGGKQDLGEVKVPEPDPATARVGFPEKGGERETKM